jgi:3,4-dihydroxy 2-butanone 4-phosphate synthase / GTP cyclohydrolase II
MDGILTDIINGKPIIIVDDLSREDEGDLMLAAVKANQYNLAFCMRHARGLMCLPCTKDRLERLNIPMSQSNQLDQFQTPFTVSVDARIGTTTGMSVFDRLKTIEVLLNEDSEPGWLSYPGHMFPLRARDKLLLERRGHTESSVELVKLAGLKPVAVIVEIMNEDGTMAKGKQLTDFAQTYALKIVSTQDIYDEIYHSSL